MRVYGSFPEAPDSPREARRDTAVVRPLVFAVGTFIAAAGLVLLVMTPAATAAMGGPATALAGAAQPQSAGTGDEAKPSTKNVLLLMVDQARSDALSSVSSDGSDGPYTPHLAKLFQESVHFSNAYTSTPICTPARQALLTGLKPWSHGSRTYTSAVVPEKYVSWAEMPSSLAAAGYHTVVIGKNHFMYNTTSLGWFDHGFETSLMYEGELCFSPTYSGFVMMDDYSAWFNATCPNCDQLATPPADQENGWYGSTYVYNESWHPTAWTGARAVEWLDEWATSEEYASGTPFFLKVSFVRPHSPYDPPARWYDDVLERVGTNLSNIAPAAKSDGGWDSVYSTDTSLCNMSVVDTHCGDPGIMPLKTSRALYYASMSFVDEWIGAVLTKFSDVGLLEKSLVLFLADHGDALGDHSMWRKGYPTEQVASIPLAIRWPKSLDKSLEVSRGDVLDNVVELRDIFPTVADFADVELTGVDGSSLLGVMRDTTTKWREFVGLEFTMCSMASWMNWAALTDGSTKYVYWLYNGTEHLFDLTMDPYETTNLAHSNITSDVQNLERWRSRLAKQWTEEGRGENWVVRGSLQTIQDCSSVEYLPNYPCYSTGTECSKA